MSGAWVCDACAEQHDLMPNVGGSFSGGGWCMVGAHRLPPGQRVVWHASVSEALIRPDASLAAAPDLAAKTPPREPKQLELL